MAWTLLRLTRVTCSWLPELLGALSVLISEDEVVAEVESLFFLADFFSRMWLVLAWRALTLPLAVSSKRFLAPEWVFVLGMADRGW